MCDDHAGPRRRSVLSGAVVLGAAAMLPAAYRKPLPRRLPLRSAARLAAFDGTSAYSMAMHIHSSFSEKLGSMDTQLYQAALNSVDVLWWTDHDHRMDGTNYRDVVHFTGLTEHGDPGQGGNWTWEPVQAGARLKAGGYGGGIVASPCSPGDPVAGGAMSLRAQSDAPRSGKTAKFGYYCDTTAGGWNSRDNLTGQEISVDVLLDPGWEKGYLEFAVSTSLQEASGGRPAGAYSLSYRFVPASQAASLAAEGLKGIRVIPVDNSAGWATVTMTPAADIAALWPDVDYRDFALYGFDIYAASAGDAVSGYLDYLRFDRTVSGSGFLAQQADMMASYAAAYPSVTQIQGTEISLFPTHFNWFGPGVTLPDYTGIGNAKEYLAFILGTVVPQIHQAGAVVSWNHPFGYGNEGFKPASAQAALLASVAAGWLAQPAPAGGCDLIEVGYPKRGGCDLATHLGLWDVMSRNGVFLTGNGTSDDHDGTGWLNGDSTSGNNWATSAWAASAAAGDLVAALAAGRAWCGSLSEFGGTGATLDLLADGECPMGSVSLSSLPARSLAVTATGIPAGGSLQVLQGAVDYAGTSGLASNVQPVASFTDVQMAAGGGQAVLPVDTTAESYVRTVVLDAGGNTVAASNPAWLLQNAPPDGIPAAREG